MKDRLLALALAAGWLALLMSTTDMGFTRDESFYFHHARVYTNWLTKLSRAEGAELRRLLSRHEVKKVWKNNSEHPPLMKVLFGLSWKHLGAKQRAVSLDKSGEIKISGLGISHGFEEGDRVPLLAPSKVGEDPRSSKLVVGEVEITARKEHSATAKVVELNMDFEELRQLCIDASSQTSPIWQTGCRVESRGPATFLSESDSFRFPTAVMGALLVGMLYLFGVRFASRTAALLSVLFFCFIPRAFFHAHLTCFDIPVTALSFATIYAFHRSLRSTLWAFVTAFLWGVALLTKLNAFFLPVTLLVWWLIAGARSVRRFPATRGGKDPGRAFTRQSMEPSRPRMRVKLPPFPLAFLLMPLIGLPMLFLLWPWLWYDSIAAFESYLGFHLHHEHYFQYYFGRAYQSPPFPVEYPFVITLLTVPVLTVVLFFVGAWQVFGKRSLRAYSEPDSRSKDSQVGRNNGWPLDDEPARAWFLAVNLLFPMVLIALPSTPIFGGVKHWLLSMPFFCFISGIGLERLLQLAGEAFPPAQTAGSRAVRVAAAVGFCCLVLAPAARDTLRYREYATSYYNEFIGGVRGAARARMQRQFWSYANRGALEYVNRHAPVRSTVDFQDATTGTCDMCKKEGLLRFDLECAERRPSAPTVLFDVEERFTEEEMSYWERLDTLGPLFEVAVDGVPVVRVYRKHAGAAVARAEALQRE